MLICLACAFHADAQTAARSVLILDQSVPAWPFSQRFINQFRATLGSSKTPVNIYAEVLDLGRFGSPEYEQSLKTFLLTKYRGRHVNVIVTLGTRATELLSHMRPHFLPGVPVVFANFEDPWTSPPGAAEVENRAQATGLFVPLRFANVVRSARIVVPSLRRLVLVGDPFERQPFRRHYAEELREFATDLEITDLSGLALDDVKARISSLPDDAAILYTAIYTDGAGVQYNPAEALRAVSEAANRPIIVDAEVSVGSGAVGGFVVSAIDVARDAAAITSRILDGAAPRDIAPTVRDMAKPVFDARQLKRWNISTATLPANSEIRYAEPNILFDYRLPVAALAALLILQSATIIWLMIERRRRHFAQMEARRRIMEAARMNRVLAAGALSASVGHELNQPLAAILSNAEAAQILLKAEPPDLPEITQILADIRSDDLRAAEIIRRLRALLAKHEPKVEDIDLAPLIHSTVHMIEPEALHRRIHLSFDPGGERLTCRADTVQLQQVVLNLVMNAMDAMNEGERERRLAIDVAPRGNNEILVSVSDTGPGLLDGQTKQVFEPLFTTKKHGTGLGLSIVREIVKSFGGQIWAENRAGGGAVFHFTLPRA